MWSAGEGTKQGALYKKKADDITAPKEEMPKGHSWKREKTAIESEKNWLKQHA